MPDFYIKEQRRFAHDFALLAADPYQPTAGEQAFLDRLGGDLGALADEQAAFCRETREPFPRTLAECRDDYVEWLRAKANAFIEQPRGHERDAFATEALEALPCRQAVYRDRMKRARMRPFVVAPRRHGGADDATVHDILIQVSDAPIAEDKQRLKVDIEQTVGIMKAVLMDRRGKWHRLAESRLVPRRLRRLLPRDRTAEEAKQRLNKYLDELHGIAHIGLEHLDPTQTPFAEKELATLKEAFREREAGQVKNEYLTRLGAKALQVIAASLAAYAVFGRLGAGAYNNFFLLAAGTAVGTWLSFSLRRVVLSFSDLAALEEDRLDPGIRMLFMVALTAIFGMLLWTNAVVVTLGGFDTQSIRTSGLAAILIGALCGIAERAMTTAVSKRAEDIVAGVSVAAAGKAAATAAKPGRA